MQGLWPCLFDDLGNDAGADGTAAFTDSEAQLLFHGDRHDQFDVQFRIIERGMIISTPSLRRMMPVTSVVRK